MDVAMELVIKAPAPLADRELTEAIGIGIFYLAMGKRPSAIPEGELKSARVKISTTAKKYLDFSLPEFNSRNDLLVHALAWVYEQAPYLRRTRI